MKYILIAPEGSISTSEPLYYDGNGFSLKRDNAFPYTDYRRDPEKHAALVSQAFSIPVRFEPIA